MYQSGTIICPFLIMLKQKCTLTSLLMNHKNYLRFVWLISLPGWGLIIPHGLKGWLWWTSSCILANLILSLFLFWFPHFLFIFTPFLLPWKSFCLQPDLIIVTNVQNLLRFRIHILLQSGLYVRSMKLWQELQPTDPV